MMLSCPSSEPNISLPADVLLSIFELDCRELTAVFPLRLSPRQFILSHVCSAWRHLILDTPTFWNNIMFRFSDSDYPRYDKMVEVPRIWLSRAKELPCVVCFSFEGPYALVSGRHRIWQHAINKHIVRDLISPFKFKDLGVTFAPYHLLDFLQIPDERLSCIEVLFLRYFHDDNDNSSISPLDFHKLSNLTSFSLIPTITVQGAECQYFPRFACIPWHQLRYIDLGIPVPALFCLDIFKATSAVLETCSLIVSEDHSFATASLSNIIPVLCQQLRKLEVCIYPNSRLDADSSFILLLRLPKLKSLRLSCPDDSAASINPETLVKMQSVCTMHLEELSIYDSVCEVDARALLASMPSLRSVELPDETKLTKDGIRELGAGTIGPLLEELILDNSLIPNELGELIQMVKARAVIGKEMSSQNIIPTAITCVTLRCDDPGWVLQQEYEDVINEVRLLGVDLHVEFLDTSDDEWVLPV